MEISNVEKDFIVTDMKPEKKVQIQYESSASYPANNAKKICPSFTIKHCHYFSKLHCKGILTYNSKGWVNVFSCCNCHPPRQEAKEPVTASY